MKVDTRQRDGDVVEATAERRLLFISHANPQDNAAAAWFATQLTALGYDVWCDVKDSHGGESAFWLKVQQKIEQEAAKFIFILSESSRDFAKKRGVYKEVQAADNLGLDNFILPLRIERLLGPLPIQIGTDIYINAENWMAGLAELCNRLEHDRVPKRARPDLERVSSWWPALSAQRHLVVVTESELASNVFGIQMLPERVHFLRVKSEGNILSGHSQLKPALGSALGHSPFGDYTITFSSAHDFQELTGDLEIEDAMILGTEDFLRSGYEPLEISAQTAQNVLTYLVAVAFENFCVSKGLESKSAGRGQRKVWFPADGLIARNRHSFVEPGKRKSPVSFVGKITHFRKTYTWHFGVQPVFDLITHRGIIFSPKVVLSLPYERDRGDRPVPIDEKKAVRKLGWWNGEWRRKVLGFAAWLADDEPFLCVPAGYQEILISSQPNVFVANRTYLAKSDSSLIREMLEGLE